LKPVVYQTNWFDCLVESCRCFRKLCMTAPTMVGDLLHVHVRWRVVGSRLYTLPSNRSWRGQSRLNCCSSWVIFFNHCIFLLLLKFSLSSRSKEMLLHKTTSPFCCSLAGSRSCFLTPILTINFGITPSGASLPSLSSSNHDLFNVMPMQKHD
jgi:hypothetical protein